MIHKRQKKFFTLFAKPSEPVRNIAKFAPSKHAHKKPHSTPKINLHLDFVRKLVRHSELMFILSLSLVLFLTLTFVHYFFMITKIEVKDKNGYPIQNWHLEGLESVKGNTILFLSTDSAEKSIRAQNPAIKSIRVNKIYPQTVDMLIQLQEPVGFFTYNTTRYFLLSAEGTLLKFVYERPKDMGEILYYQSVSPGEYALGKPMGSRDIRFSAQIAGLLNKYGFTEFTITIQDSHLIRVEIRDLTIQAASDSDNQKQLSSLDQLLRIMQKGGEKIKSVDVRFDKIIIEK